MKKSKYNYWVLLVLAAALLLAFLVSTFLILFSRVIGPSMEPILHENDWIVTSRLAYGDAAPLFGDIVLIKKPDVSDEILVKRIMGVPGDSLEIRKGRFYRNGTAVTEEFGTLNNTETMGKIAVPDDCYFLMGDNRARSSDSRAWKNPFVRSDEILGKVLIRLFPKITEINR